MSTWNEDEQIVVVVEQAKVKSRDVVYDVIV